MEQLAAMFPGYTRYIKTEICSTLETLTDSWSNNWKMCIFRSYLKKCVEEFRSSSGGTVSSTRLQDMVGGVTQLILEYQVSWTPADSLQHFYMFKKQMKQLDTHLKWLVCEQHWGDTSLFVFVLSGEWEFHSSEYSSSSCLAKTWAQENRIKTSRKSSQASLKLHAREAQPSAQAWLHVLITAQRWRSLHHLSRRHGSKWNTRAGVQTQLPWPRKPQFLWQNRRLEKHS